MAAIVTPPIAGPDHRGNQDEDLTYAAESQQSLDEERGAETSEPAEQRVREQFLPVAQAVAGNRQHGPAAKQRALDDCRGDRRHDDGADQALIEIADHFFHGERDRGNRRVERRGDAGRGTDAKSAP